MVADNTIINLLRERAKISLKHLETLDKLIEDLQMNKAKTAKVKFNGKDEPDLFN